MAFVGDCVDMATDVAGVGNAEPVTCAVGSVELEDDWRSVDGGRVGTLAAEDGAGGLRDVDASDMIGRLGTTKPDLI